MTHGRDWTWPGFRALAVHRFGMWVRRESGRGLIRGPIRKLLFRLHLMMFRYVRNHYGIELPMEAAIGRRVLIGHQGGIVVHPNAVIGDECVLRQNVTLGALNWEHPSGAPRLGRGVQIGAGAIVIGAVTIGDGARIGPNTVVMNDVPAGASVFVGSPRMIVLNMRLAETDERQHESPDARLRAVL
jgi:serine O-acetyltransferase